MFLSSGIQKSHEIRAFTLAAACMFSVFPGAAQAERTVVILDASSSMKTVLEDETRLSVAKSAVRDVVETIHREAPAHELGFVSFYDGCWVDPMQEVAPVRSNRSEILRHVDALATREYGHTPIIRSLEVAADLLSGEGGNIILVSDGHETCDEHRDLCAMAEDLHKQNIALKVHLVALGMTQKQRDKVMCVPKATGGTFVTADDRAQLELALGFATELVIQGEWSRCHDNRGGLLFHWCGE